MSSPKLQALMRDLLAEGRISINESRLINLEIEGASTQPEGCVPVPAELLRMVAGCAYPVSSEIDPRGYSWSEAYLDEVLPKIKAALLAACSEVSGG